MKKESIFKKETLRPFYLNRKDTDDALMCYFNYLLLTVLNSGLS